MPNLWSLADTYTISDMTFETGTARLVGLAPAAGRRDDRRVRRRRTERRPDRARGRVRQRVERWHLGRRRTASQYVPSCIPDKHGQGAVPASPVQYVPTIMDRMDAAGPAVADLRARPADAAGYGWAICPTFYECLGGAPGTDRCGSPRLRHGRASGHASRPLDRDPDLHDSQHNGYSLMQGDNWIAQNVAARDATARLGLHRDLHHLRRLRVLLRPRSARRRDGHPASRWSS